MPRVFFLLVAGLILSALQFASAADFTVTNTNSAGAGSLAQAITDANNLAGADRILFNIPGAGVHKINAGQTRLPTVLESLAIDGYSQPGAKPNSLAVGNNAIILIQVDAAADATTSTTGLYLDGGLNQNGLPADYTVRGLSLTGFGIALAVAGESSLIAGNFIGLLPDGETARGNYRGISSVSATTVGGTDPASRNVISGNTDYGWTGGGLVTGNYIGTNAQGTKAVPNRTGLLLVGNHPATIIGGTTTGSGNLISGNTIGIYFGEVHVNPNAPSFFIETPGSSFRIEGNLIGVQADGINPLANQYPIQFLFGSNNIIGGLEPAAGNVIAFNGSGIGLASLYSNRRGGGPGPPSEGNQILSNSIYANAGPAIDLASNGATPNDPGDPDQGPNTFQNTPVISSAEVANGSVTIKGTLNSTANTQFTLQYFSESLNLLRPMQTYLGTSTVSTDADGNAQFSAAFPIQETNVAFNMTATSPAGNTSEFPRNPGRLQNISTRAFVEKGDNVTIAGFIVTTNSLLVLRALGPSLAAYGFAEVLTDPLLEIYDSTGKLIRSNDNWRDSGFADDINNFGLAPTNDLESAIFIGVPAGNYTAVVRAQGGSGWGLVEVYNKNFLDAQRQTVVDPQGQTVNLSTRGLVQTGNKVLIAGLIIEPVPGSTRIVARALGPSLAAAGIAGPLPDPTLALYNAEGTLIDSNDNWRNGRADELTAVGLALSNDTEAAIFERLNPGQYTAIVDGKGSATGVALVEIYNLH